MFTTAEKLVLLAFVVCLALAGRAFACEDIFRIEDRGPFAAEVYYQNGGYPGRKPNEGCSGSVPPTLTSPNGIEVALSISVNDGEGDHKWSERIRVTPLNAEFSAYPPEELVPDGEEIRIMVTRGLM